MKEPEVCDVMEFWKNQWHGCTPSMRLLRSDLLIETRKLTVPAKQMVPESQILMKLLTKRLTKQ